MNLLKRPYKWVSAHQPIEFTMEPPRYALSSVGSGSGFAIFSYITDGLYTPVVGDRLVISTGAYQGFHTITAVGTSNIFGVVFQDVTTETTYTTTQNDGYVCFQQEISLGIYKGGGALYATKPFTYIAGFRPEINLEGLYVFDISGYVQKVFDVVNSNESLQFGGLLLKPNLYENIEVYMNVGVTSGIFVGQLFALNSAIDSDQLNRDYVDTGLNLNDDAGTNFYFSCGLTENIQIVGDFLKVVGQYDDGILETISPYFDSGFDAGFFHG